MHCFFSVCTHPVGDFGDLTGGSFLLIPETALLVAYRHTAEEEIIAVKEGELSYHGRLETQVGGVPIFRDNAVAAHDRLPGAHGLGQLDHTPSENGSLLEGFHNQLFCKDTNRCDGEDSCNHKGGFHIEVRHINGPSDPP
jgi:hypothetical protein